MPGNLAYQERRRIPVEHGIGSVIVKHIQINVGAIVGMFFLRLVEYIAFGMSAVL